MNNLLNEEKLLAIFEQLNSCLVSSNTKIDIIVYGGAMMALLFNNRPSTSDIDCRFNSDKIDVRVLENIRQQFSLTNDWLNQDVKEPISFLKKETIDVFKEYSNLRILKPSLEQLLAMKILASRVEPAKDFVDAYILCKSLCIEKKEQLLKIVYDYVPEKYIGERQHIFIRYLGEDLGFNDWK